MNILLSVLFVFVFSIRFIQAQQEFVIGEFTVSKILDGDTFRFDGMDKSTRLLGIDTEETFKDSDAEMKVNDITSGWLEYYEHKKDSSGKPAKIESPYGYNTWQWTKELFTGVIKVRLEADDFKRVFDMYNRYLVYVIAIKEDGTEFNYNIECVKQGYSPYFSKYGYSARFHDAFVLAQEYAQKNKLGIWSGKELCYPDYTERIEWWNERADQIRKFETAFAGKSGYYSMLDPKDYEKLKVQLNDTVTIFSNIAKVLRENDPHIVKFEINDSSQIDLVFFKSSYSLIKELNLDNPKDYYIYAKGKLTDYKGRLQIIIEDASQVWTE
jgi:endonuclease YncB( thermonuclease family)